jgi:hypothetical protein
MSFISVDQLLETFERAGQRIYMVGDIDAGAIIALDMEGRIFTILNGIVLNRVNLDAISNRTESNQYNSPGGDVLWPAPEGTLLGYFYSSGEWRVPPGLSNAKYFIHKRKNNNVQIYSEIDLINSQALGIPTIFGRNINLITEGKTLTVKAHETITYVGNENLTDRNCIIVPWSLCQLDCNYNCNVTFPSIQEEDYWNLYNTPFNSFVERRDKDIKVITNGRNKFQLGLSKNIPWIKYSDTENKLLVKRKAGMINQGDKYIDIQDAPGNVEPNKKGVRYSIYNSKEGFMEIEAVGGSPSILCPGTKICLTVETHYSKN